MQRKKQITIACIVALSALSSHVFAQQTINVSSNSATINNMQFDYSIGEMTLVTTERNANLIVTQGLLQPNGSGTGTQSQPTNIHLSNADLIKVYPNPTENILFVESMDNVDALISYQLFDATGKVVLSKEINQKAGANKLTLDLQTFAAGSYYLMLRKPNADGNLENYSFKIQKTN